MKDSVRIIYTWKDERKEVRYERYIHDPQAILLMKEVEEAQARCESLGEECTYFYEIV